MVVGGSVEDRGVDRRTRGLGGSGEASRAGHQQADRDDGHGHGGDWHVMDSPAARPPTKPRPAGVYVPLSVSNLLEHPHSLAICSLVYRSRAPARCRACEVLVPRQGVGDAAGAAPAWPPIASVTRSPRQARNARLGAASGNGNPVLDLGCGWARCCALWARDYGVIGTGIDMSQLFTEQARLRAEELGVADQVTFIQGDAAGFVSDEKAGVAACLGATWIAGGVVGTIELLAQSLRPGGIILIGEPYWRQLPPTENVAKGCLAGSISDSLLLPELLASFVTRGGRRNRQRRRRDQYCGRRLAWATAKTWISSRVTR